LLAQIAQWTSLMLQPPMLRRPTSTPPSPSTVTGISTVTSHDAAQRHAYSEALDGSRRNNLAAINFVALILQLVRMSIEVTEPYRTPASPTLRSNFSQDSSTFACNSASSVPSLHVASAARSPSICFTLLASLRRSCAAANSCAHSRFDAHNFAARAEIIDVFT
jgi:hypothetical protein